jgi:ATP-dependent Clp protease ATP-binding subunit ClpB
LKRAIQKEILDPLSMQILEGKFREGQAIRVDVKDGKLTFVAK